VVNASTYCEIVSDEKSRIGVSYRVTLAMGKEVASIASISGNARHHTNTISLLHILAEVVPTRAGPTGSDDTRVGETRVNRKHSELLLVAGMVIKVHTYGGEAAVVVDGNAVVAFCAELPTCSNDEPCGISYPFVWLG
jgi:hypothetical protein